MDKYPQFIGEQTWNFADFETSNGIIRVQVIRKVSSRDRKPKAIAHYFKNVGITFLISIINHNV